MKFLKTILTTIVLFIFSLILAKPAIAANFLVDSTGDEVDANPGDGTCASINGRCTLRAAVQETNALSGWDTISFANAGTYTLNLNGVDDLSAVGDLDILDDLFIYVADPTKEIIIDGNGVNRVFEILGGSVDLVGLTIQNGVDEDGWYGAGIVNWSNLDVMVCDVLNNQQSGIANYGNLGVYDSTLAYNGIGGSFSDYGGGLLNTGNASLVDVTINNNVAFNGGGISNFPILDDNGDPTPAVLTMINVTISDNTADFGGGIDDYQGNITATNITIHQNTAILDGSGVISDHSTNGSFEVINSIIANNYIEDCGHSNPGDITSLGNNLSSDNTCAFTAAGDMENTDPLLDPLADNGGYTLTHALNIDSPAIDAGDQATCTATVPFDQRWVERPQPAGGVCDIGAYEYDGPWPTPSPTATPIPTATPTPEPTATPTPEPTPSIGPIPTATPTPEPSPTATPSPEPTPSIGPIPTATPTPEPIPTATPTPEPTVTPTPEPTVTPTPEPSPTGDPGPAPTATPTPSIGPAPTTTPTPGDDGGDDGGQGGSDEPGSASPPGCHDGEPSEAPPNFRVVSQTANSVTLAWNPVEPATHYALVFTRDSDGAQYGADNIGNVTEYTINGLDVNASYTFEVMAINGCMPGDRARLSSNTVIGSVYTGYAYDDSEPYGDDGQVLAANEAEVVNYDEEPESTTEASSEPTVASAVVAIDSSCGDWRNYIPWVLLIAQVVASLAIEYWRKDDQSKNKWVALLAIALIPTIIFYLIRDCRCYGGGILDWLCKWYFIVAALLAGVTRFFSYGFVEDEEEKKK